MLAAVRGTLLHLHESTAHVLPSGLAGLVLEIVLPAYAVEALAPAVGAEIHLVTRLTLESQTQGASFSPRLIGFPDKQSREFFELLTTVHGLGGRRALRAMALPPSAMAALIVAQDAPALQKLPEIGKKLAQTIITELHEKAALYLDTEITPKASGSPVGRGRTGPIPAHRDALAAFIALGQPPAEAERLLLQALDTLGPSAQEPTADQILAAAFGR